MGNTLGKAVWLCNKKCIYRLESMHSKTNLDLLPIHRHVLVSTDGSVGGLLVEGPQNTQAVNKLGADSSRTSKVLEETRWEGTVLVRDKAGCGLTAWSEQQCMLKSFEPEGYLRAAAQLALLGEKGDSPAAEWGARGLAIAEQDELAHTAACSQEFEELLSIEEAHIAADEHAPVWHCELPD